MYAWDHDLAQNCCHFHVVFPYACALYLNRLMMGVGAVNLQIYKYFTLFIVHAMCKAEALILLTH